ncbi:MAG: hypothetical protein J6T10_21620 [Methanobrevibacter sp.]|nr:hypothetical protein [Methanobrevibacter sp.]
MKIVHIRFNENDEELVEWIEEQAKKESLPVSTFIRVFLAREKYCEDIEKQFGKKKRGNK